MRNLWDRAVRASRDPAPAVASTDGPDDTHERHRMTQAPPEEMTEYSLTSLLTPSPTSEAPPDFDAFWRATFAEFGPGPVEWEHVSDLESTPMHRASEIRFDSSAAEQVTAFLLVPHTPSSIRRGLVVGHGYGGREGPDLDRVPADTAAIFPCAPGMHPGTPSRFPSAADVHVLAGISRRETYAHRFAAADIWRAATVLLEIAPSAADALDYSGESFGGGVGAMALPWDARFRRASLDVPSFGDHAVRLSRPCTGSGEAVRRHLRVHPEDRAVLDYFDAATAARRLRIPVHVAAAVLDPAVDPRGQFAVYHALTGPRRLTVRAQGHLDGPVADASNQLAVQNGIDFFALPEDRLR